MECFGTTDFDNNSRLKALSAIIISGLHCIGQKYIQFCMEVHVQLWLLWVLLLRLFLCLPYLCLLPKCYGYTAIPEVFCCFNVLYTYIHSYINLHILYVQPVAGRYTDWATWPFWLIFKILTGCNQYIRPFGVGCFSICVSYLHTPAYEH
jgi:hypothetical protein